MQDTNSSLHNIEYMPRLIGKSSKAPLYVGTALVVAVAGAIALEYSGVIDIIPNFGKDQKVVNRSHQSEKRQTSKIPTTKRTTKRLYAAPQNGFMPSDRPIDNTICELKEGTTNA
jgi:hypothetical protein